MKNIIFFIFIFLSSTRAFADEDLYAVEKQDGSVVIVGRAQGSSDSLETLIRDFGLEGLPIKRVKRFDLPTVKDNPQEFWKMSDSPFGPKVVVDEVKKAESEANKKVIEERKRTVLKMTKEEYQEAKDLGIFR